MAKDMKYYRSDIQGLSVVVGPPKGNDVGPETVRFEPYDEMWQGDHIKVGYCATDNAVAIEKLDADINVESITAEQFDQATNAEVNPKVRKLSNQ